MSDVERTLPASPRRRAWAREQGCVPRSGAMTSALLLGVAACCLMMQGPRLIDDCATQVQSAFQEAPRAAFLLDVAVTRIRGAILSAGLVGAWILTVAWGASLAASMVQVGLIWSPSTLVPDWSRVMPDSGARLLSSDNLVASLWSVLTIVAVSVATAFMIALRFESYLGSLHAPIAQVVNATISEVGRSMLELSAVLIAVATIDLAWRRWRFEESLMMSPEEAREEAANSRRRAVR